MSSQKWAHVHAEAAELAAEVRREPLDKTARVASLEKRRRKQDEPARKAYANQSLALRFFVQFVGYSPEVKDTLNAAIEAAAGLDHAITRTDWEMGCYLRGIAHADMERIRALPARDTEKITLAKAWKRAFDDYQAEERRTGIVALRRIPGSMDLKTGQKRASQIHALCAQDMAEIATAATKVHGKRFERFAQAAAAHVAILRDDPARRAHTKDETDEIKPKRMRQPDTPALLMVRAASKVEKLAEGLRRDLPPEMRAEARAHLIAALATLDDEAEVTQEAQAAAEGGDPVHLDLKNKKVDKTAETDLRADRKSADTENAEASKNAGADGVVVDKLSTTSPPKSPPPATSETYRKAITFAIDEKLRAGVSLDVATAQVKNEIGDEDGWLARMATYSGPLGHTCPSPDVAPELIEEKVFIMCEENDMSPTEAAPIARRKLCEVCAAVAKIRQSQAFEYAPDKFM